MPPRKTKTSAAAPPPAAADELPPPDATVVDNDDSLPPWPGDAEPDADDSPIDANPSEISNSSPPPEAPVAEEPQAEEPAAPAEEIEEEPVAPAAPAAPAARGPAQTALSRLGWDTANLSEEQAANFLAEEIARRDQVLHNLRMGQQPGAPQAPAPAAPAPAPEPEPPRPSVAAELKKKIEQLGPKPEFEESWYRLGLQFDGTSWYAPPNAPHYQAQADKLNAYNRWEKRKAALLQDELPEVIERLESIDRSPKGGMTQEQFEAELTRREQQREIRNFVSQVQQEHGTWMFEHGTDGKVIVHPHTRQPITTREGQMYFAHIQKLFDDGVTDPRMQHRYAMALLGNEIEKPRARVDSGALTVPDSAAASSGAPAPTAQAGLKAKQRARAIRQPNAAVAPAARAAQQGQRKPTFEEALAEKFNQLPESAFGVPDDE